MKGYDKLEKTGVRYPSDDPAVLGVSLDVRGMREPVIANSVLSEVMNALTSETQELRITLLQGEKTHFTAVDVRAIRKQVVDALLPLANDIAAQVAIKS